MKIIHNSNRVGSGGGGRIGVADPLGAVFQQGQQQARVDRVTFGHQGHNLRAAEGFSVDILAEKGQIAAFVLDIAVDIRTNSATFGKWFSCVLSQENNLMMFIPEGFAHGFITLEENTVFLYKCSKVYNKESESGIIWNDPELNINWGVSNPVLSEKDVLFTTLEQSQHYF